MTKIPDLFSEDSGNGTSDGVLVGNPT